MAPIPLTLIHRTTKSYSHSNSSSSAGGIGGGVVAAIIVIALIIFICVFIHEYNKGVTFPSSALLDHAFRLQTLRSPSTYLSLRLSND